MGVQSHVEGRFGSIKAGCNRPWLKIIFLRFCYHYLSSTPFSLTAISSMSSESESRLRQIPTLVSYCQRGQFESARSAHSRVDLCVRCCSAVSACRWYGHQDGIRLLTAYLPSLLALSCLGEGIRYGLIKPVLECCSADTLFRLEQSSPVGTSVLYSLLCLIIAAVFSRKYLGYSLSLPCLAIVPNTTTRPMGVSMLQDVPSTCRTTRTHRRTAS